MKVCAQKKNLSISNLGEYSKHQINIAQMAVGRASSKPGGAAIGVLNLDSVPSDEAIKELMAIGKVMDKVQTITLPERGVLPPWLQG